VANIDIFKPQWFDYGNSYLDNKLTEDVKLDALPELNHLELRGNRLKTTPTKLDSPKLQRLYLVQ
jgi:Leucine-rich repeat (LRR) protein